MNILLVIFNANPAPVAPTPTSAKPTPLSNSSNP